MDSWKFLIFFVWSILGIIVGVAAPTFAQETEKECMVCVAVDSDGSTLTIIPTYARPGTASDTTALHYEFSVERTGASTFRTRQGGMFTPTPDRVDTLSTVRLSAQPGDRLRLHLIVHRKDETIVEISRTEQISDSE